MTVIQISFDPSTIKQEHECWPAFQAGGLVLKVWALYKRRFLTDQHFRPALERLADLIKASQQPGAQPLYNNIQEFQALLQSCGLIPEWHALDLRNWLEENWEYFDPENPRALRVEYRPATTPTNAPWTVVRFPAGDWSTGGKPSSPDYAKCEVYLIPAESREKAKKTAQNVRRKLVRKGLPLPSQDAPYQHTSTTPGQRPAIDHRGQQAPAARSRTDDNDQYMETREVQQPIGIVQSMHGAPGFTMVCFAASEVPAGTAVYADPPKDVEQETPHNRVLATLLLEAKWALDVLEDQFGMEDCEGMAGLRAAIAEAEQHTRGR